MGVYGLLSHCLEHREECVQYIDLVEVARQRNGIQLLVDFYSFEHMILGAFWRSQSSVHHNPFLRIQGGEYKRLDAYVTKLVKDLQSLDIHLVLFVDGAKGSSATAFQRRLNTWKSRHHKDLQKCHEILEVCSGSRRISHLSESSNVRPVCLEVQIFQTLRQCECEIVQLTSGEADYVLARNLVNRPKAVAVLSNDSDFCIFKDSKFIPNDLFDLQNDLALGKEQTLPEKPIRLMVGVITSDRVCDLFQFRNHSELIELSILQGNDLTDEYVQDVKYKLHLKGKSRLLDVAKFIREYRRADNHQIVQKEMQRNPTFADAIEQSRQFYCLAFSSGCESDNIDEASSPITTFLREGVEQGKYPGSIMAMHRNLFWHRMLLEDMSPGRPCVEVSLAQLRAHIYRMILDRSHNTVIEYGRTPYEELATMQVNSCHARLPTVHYINKDKIFQNLGTFAKIMTHLEPNSYPDWHKRYGWRTGFKCYVFRYMLVLNTGANLYLHESEAMALLAMLFCQVNEDWYMSLQICPSTRCVTVGNWYQAVYRYAYEFLGKLLHLSHEFPEPKSMFCGSVWTAFYTITQYHGPPCSQFPGDVLQRVHNDMNYIIREKRHMIRYLLQGIFPFETR